ncbi:MAG: 16S rRNA (uracil(1498)-N(3))-methyltransferase [candidate division Zixibacteria bacterium]|nr:16S rRNA (uracil(1498)-N(3))-methyltransferase [candidate division Zixibacteria bacterium]
MVEKNKYALKDIRFEHIINILKLSIGDEIEIGILNGSTGIAQIDSISSEQLTIKSKYLQPQIEIKPEKTLICALPRPQTVKKVLITSAMMGIKNIHFIRANRVEKSYYHSPLLEPGNIKPYLLEGLSQGKNTQLPTVTIHKRFKPFFEDYFPSVCDDKTIKLLPDIETDCFLNSFYSCGNNPLALVIGPEGGWVPFEIDLMKETGFRPYRLSQSVLRVEHALTAALAQIELIVNTN